ncbi:NACHT domain-containing protein [Marinobacter lacisalsi]|uniref:NACHT domain-containing protein n=1 Tax=Marinobacter lacisalsi TaxID=475979 RepID=A0ABV8QBE1_9GAMM
MDTKKTERISKLKHEVNDLHPILEVLFKRLPQISNVEYTQGPQEMGADFVLTKVDETLGGEEYIGCVVKVGKIKQDHQEIVRQIEECEIKRKIEGGKKEIFLTEIWVITNENITGGAQEKIHHRFNNKNVKFISGERLVLLIDKHYPEYWKDVSVSTGEYLRTVQKKADELSIAGSVLGSNNEDHYIPQTLERVRPKKQLNKLRSRKTKFTIEQATAQHPFILVEAQMGTGKSTLLAEVARKLSDSETFNLTHELPVLITAKELLEKYHSNCTNLIAEVEKENEPLEDQKYTLLIDALDELKIPAGERIDFLEGVAQSINGRPNIKLIITTRNIDNPEQEAEIEKHYARFRLSYLTIAQVIGLVENYCKDKTIATKLSKDINKSQLFRKLPKTPISAILLAKLLNEHVQEIPSTMTELYEKYMELVIGRWDMSKGLQSQREYEVLLNVIINSATMIMENSLLDLPIGDVRSLFNQYVDDRNLKIEKEELFQKMLFKSEIFTFNEQRQTLRFRHRTFTEFFFAKGLNRDSTATISQEIYDLYWNTSYFFYLGLRRDCPEILEQINNIEFTNDRYELLKIFSHGSFLLAAYLTPYKQIEKSVTQSFSEAARLYDDVVNNRIESPLTALPSVQILCLFTSLLCENFSYEYFIPALEAHAEDLFTSPNKEDRDFAELFLTESVLITLKNQKAYDRLIKDYGKSIPVQIQAGIMEHSADENNDSPVVKKFVKNFKKRIKSNLGLRKYLIKMYESPVYDESQGIESKSAQ